MNYHIYHNYAPRSKLLPLGTKYRYRTCTGTVYTRTGTVQERSTSLYSRPRGCISDTVDCGQIGRAEPNHPHAESVRISMRATLLLLALRRLDAQPSAAYPCLRCAEYPDRYTGDSEIRCSDIDANFRPLYCQGSVSTRVVDGKSAMWCSVGFSSCGTAISACGCGPKPPPSPLPPPVPPEPPPPPPYFPSITCAQYPDEPWKCPFPESSPLPGIFALLCLSSLVIALVTCKRRGMLCFKGMSGGAKALVEVNTIRPVGCELGPGAEVHTVAKLESKGNASDAGGSLAASI